MFEVTLRVRLTLEGPVLSHSTSPGSFGVDAQMARDSQGRYYIPFQLVRGHLLQAWQELNEAAGAQFDPPIGRLLGRKTGDAYETGPDTVPRGQITGAYEPVRGILAFSDFRCEPSSPNLTQLYRLRIDSQRGAATLGALQMAETPFISGQRAVFEGTISYIATGDPDAQSINRYLEKGLRWMTSLGGERSVGFGRLLEVGIEEVKRKTFEFPSTNLSAPAASLMHISIRPQAPFCVAKRRIGGNLFESDIILAGRVLRGALATSLRRLASLPETAVIDGSSMPAVWRELGEHFDKIRFTHAFPAPEGTDFRPVRPPLSLVQNVRERDSQGTPLVYDVACLEGPKLLKSPTGDWAPQFSTDWKESDGTQCKVDQEFGWGSLKTEFRVRTAMDRDSRRAKDKQLFAYEMVVPQGFHWLARADLSAVPIEARKAVESQLSALFDHGLGAVGKTKTKMDVLIRNDIVPRHDSNVDPIEGKWIITLQTPALICDPKNLDETSGRAELIGAYDEAWKGLSHDTLNLVTFFATQSLAGGYLVRRFQPGKPYNPFLLTDPGSVFVLTASDGNASAAQKYIEQWLEHGLGLPVWAIERYGDADYPGNHWQRCPFLPEDGFGEIAVNLPCHQEMRPPGGDS